MARALRISLHDGWYHVFHRGTERRSIFVDDHDRIHFLDLLADVHERYRFRIHAAVLMTNHYHAILQTPDANLSAGMQWLHLSHAAWFNARHARVGPFWQGRFRSVPVENSAWAYTLSLYVHLNPLNVATFGMDKRGKRAEAQGLRTPSAEEITQRLKALRDYRWSSYRVYAGYEHGPAWLDTGPILERASLRKDDQQRCYREEVKNLLRKGGNESVRERLRDAVAVGGEAFRSRIKAFAAGGVRETSGKRELRRRIAFEDVLQAVEQVSGQKREQFLSRRGDWGTPLTMWLGRRYCGRTLREIGEALGGKDYAAVSDRLRRFDSALAADKTLNKQREAAVRILNLEI